MTLNYRLARSLPKKVLDAWDEELKRVPLKIRDAERRKRIEAHLDAGHGDCWLRRPEVATLVENAFLFFDGSRYRLHAWVVMPNHVHVLFTRSATDSISDIVKSWKSFTSHRALKTLRIESPFWQPDYFDRFIRDEKHYAAAVDYIEMNPVKAGLCRMPEEWPFSSARWRRKEE